MPDHQNTMNDLYPLAIIFVPLIVLIGFSAWALRRWVGHQDDAIRARCGVAKVIFGLVSAIFLMALFGQIWSFSMDRSQAWFPHPSILIALATTGLIYLNARKRMKSMTP
jgi:hypothetical protein